MMSLNIKSEFRSCVDRGEDDNISGREAPLEDQAQADDDAQFDHTIAANEALADPR